MPQRGALNWPSGRAMDGSTLWNQRATLEDDPNVTDKKFPGNPTRSYRTREPVKVVVEPVDWVLTVTLCGDDRVVVRWS